MSQLDCKLYRPEDQHWFVRQPESIRECFETEWEQLHLSLQQFLLLPRTEREAIFEIAT